MMRRIVCFGFLVLIPVTVGAEVGGSQVGRPISISQLTCKNLKCEATQGLQDGLDSVEAEASGLRYPSVRLRVMRVTRSQDPEIKEDRRIGIMGDGRLTISIAAYRHPDGEYTFLVTPVNSEEVIASGSYVKGGKTAGPVPAAPPVSAAGYVGTWRGINGTAGEIRIQPDGTYTFNGTPGTYRINGSTIVFSGPLAGWNHGQAHLNSGALEFLWDGPQGRQWFTFGKVQ